MKTHMIPHRRFYQSIKSSRTVRYQTIACWMLLPKILTHFLFLGVYCFYVRQVSNTCMQEQMLSVNTDMESDPGF